MKSRVAYGPGRGLKKPRGPRAKAAIRRAAREAAYAAAHARTLARGGRDDLLRRARWATVKAGGKWRDLRRVAPDPLRGVVRFVFRDSAAALVPRVARMMYDLLPLHITAMCECDS